ncbi:DUF445 domain-containing protein [Clostridiisalibacter paucivorans]|uniref:DUF445 domain-containing protein n=1 Tax=Clostridiisalibacter paucivorans TaxID=408753 RepID=UPI00047AD0E0|nr:DUF445 family protein [Clostridiisalibacter paucivorans]
MIFKIAILAAIGSMIGWITNIIAIKLIFRPLYPVTIPLFNISFQGLIPKRKNEIAKSIGEVVEEELLSVNEILDKMIDESDISYIKNSIKTKIGLIVKDKLPQFLPATVKNMILNYIDDIVETEGESILKQFIEDMVDKASERVSLSKMVEDKINSYDMEKIEEIIINIAKKELKHIEILGAILGFVIGIFQGIIILLLG